MSELTGTQLTQLISTQDELTEIPERKPHSWGKLIGNAGAIYLDKDLVRIGRHRTSDIFVDNLKISNRHCSLYLIDGSAFIEDTSSNGTKLNGIRLEKGQRRPLSNQDHIELLRDEIYFIFDDLKSRNCEDIEGEVSQKYYILDQVLGTGNFAVVKVAVDKFTGKRYACKIIDKKKIAFTTKQKAHLDQEIEILRGLDHPNIVRLYDVYEQETKLYIMLELVEGGELFTYISSDNGLEESQAQFIFYQLLQGVKYLHQNNISHRDIKPENIMIESSSSLYPRIAITDFGLAKVKAHQNALTTMCGTLNYLAPEVLFGGGEGYGFEVDCWSLGVVLYAMLSSTLPFTEDDQKDLIRSIKRGDIRFPTEDWHKISDEGKDMIRKLLMVNPSKRLTIQQALKHAWIANRAKSLSTLYDIKVLRKNADETATENIENIDKNS